VSCHDVGFLVNAKILATSIITFCESRKNANIPHLQSQTEIPVVIEFNNHIRSNNH
jgi:hypothetical protein